MYVYILEAPVRMEHYKNIGHLRRITYDGSVGRSNLRRICDFRRKHGYLRRTTYDGYIESLILRRICDFRRITLRRQRLPS